MNPTDWQRENPSHVAPDCPDCGHTGAVGPAVLACGMQAGLTVEDLRCAACGLLWTEKDPDRLARAYYGQGASDQERRIEALPIVTVTGVGEAEVDR